MRFCVEGLTIDGFKCMILLKISEIDVRSQCYNGPGNNHIWASDVDQTRCFTTSGSPRFPTSGLKDISDSLDFHFDPSNVTLIKRCIIEDRDTCEAALEVRDSQLSTAT